MQTLLSKVIVIFTISFLQASLFSALLWSLIELATPMNPIIAKFLVFANAASANAFMLSISAVLITKYLSIYHSTFLAMLDEGYVLPMIRVVVFGLPWILSIIQHVWLRHAEVHWIYLILTETVAPSLHIPQTISIFSVIVLFNIVLMIFVLSRIEYDYSEDGCILKIRNWIKTRTAMVAPVLPQQHIQQDQEIQEEDTNNSTSGYSINVLRILCLLAVSMLTFILYYGAGYVRAVLLRALFAIIFPLIFILSHSGIKACMQHQLKGILEYFTSCL